MRDRPFTVAQAEAAGVSRKVLRGHEWRHIFRDVYAHASVEDTRLFRFHAVKLVLPPYAVARALTAAWLNGADVRREDDLDVHIGYPKGRRRRKRPGLEVCQETLAAEDITVMYGVAVTTPVRTAFDCLRLLKGIEGIVVADALAHLQRTSVEEMTAYFDSHRRLRNVRIGERRLERVDPGAESPMETRMRLRLIDAGLPIPVSQWEVKTPGGAFVARVDLAYPELRVAVEYDGAWHWAQRRADDRRRERVRALGWIVLVYSAEDVFEFPERMCAEVWAATRSRTASSATLMPI